MWSKIIYLITPSNSKSAPSFEPSSKYQICDFATICNWIYTQYVLAKMFC